MKKILLLLFFLSIIGCSRSDYSDYEDKISEYEIKIEGLNYEIKNLKEKLENCSSKYNEYKEFYNKNCKVGSYNIELTE